ncbi:uncharacterized protein Tco025E_03901 [Trypanosoma conorhini]|uniref:Uncharacterized protein n=1 Tax=Trypanosoma conorhini TaxID=83891 RepID=A0A422PR30_9TRYP|nr:uncharacterized protein Tco025E_03901 [Trypanosoma conorhini]RNF20199.1 hypothetical protein Tco025E_03901 [Trypanosoma conorhini]
MKHFRGWLVVCLVSAALFMLVDIPVAQQQNLRTRTIFVAVMTPAVWALYLVLLYVFLHRPLQRSTGVYRKGAACRRGASDDGVFLWFKEQHKLNAVLVRLQSETESVERLSSGRQPASPVGRNSPTLSLVRGAAAAPTGGSPILAPPNGAL